MHDCPDQHFAVEPTILSPMLVSDNYIPQLAEHALRHGHTVPLATEHLQLLDPDYGTVFHFIWKRQTYRTMNSGGR